MSSAQRSRWAAATLASVAVAAAVAVGVGLRLADPLSTPVIPAEDPYTHMALVREHLRDGTLDPLNTPGTLYPPGLHGFLAAAWVYTGADLYTIFRFGPVVLGAIGVLATALLLWRFEGPVAAGVGALAAAVAPEMVFRTTMMSPTALDLALLPCLLYLLLEVMGGRLAWAAVAVPLAAFLALSHPWLFGVLGVAGLAFVALALVIPLPSPRGAPLCAQGLGAAAAIVGLGCALSLSGCWGACGPGFTDVLPGGGRLAALAPLVAAVALLPAVAAMAAPRPLQRLLDRAAGRTLGLRERWAASAGLAAFTTILVASAIWLGLPPQVDLPRMFGWPILALAAAGIVALPFISGPAAHMGAALSLATAPFVLYNPFHSLYWSHRTAVYMGVGLVLLAAVLSGALVRKAAAAWASHAETMVVPRGRPAMAALVSPLVVVSIATGVYAATPPGYSWYRMFDDCEFAGLQEVARAADAQPSALVVTGDWQSKLVLAALASNASRIWYKHDFFTSAAQRAGVTDGMAHQGRPVLAVVDRYLNDTGATPGPDTGFLHSPPWRGAGAWCNGTGAAPARPSLSAYTTQGVAT